MKKSSLLFAALLGFAFVPSAHAAREFRDLTNAQGVKIHAELLDLTPEGVLKVNVNLKPFEIPLSQLSPEDQEWIKTWDTKRKHGEEAAYYNREIFADDFSSNNFGPRWGHYKSGSVVKDGILVGITPEGSDHSAVDNIKFEGEQDLEVSVKFQFTSDKARSFNVWLDDKDYKESHAGHIAQVTVSPVQVVILDAKTGSFRKDIYTKRKTPEGLSAEENAYLATKTARFPIKLALNEWHTLVVRTRGDEIFAVINGKEAGKFKSEGVSHATKSLVSLTTNPVDVQYDDFSIKAGGQK